MQMFSVALHVSQKMEITRMSVSWGIVQQNLVH